MERGNLGVCDCSLSLWDEGACPCETGGVRAGERPLRTKRRGTMDRRGYCYSLMLSAVLISFVAAGNAHAQLSFYDNWNPGLEWSAKDYGSGQAEKGGVNLFAYCDHFSEDPVIFLPIATQAPCDTDPFGVRAGLWRAVSCNLSGTCAGHPNEVWAWRLVNVTPGYDYSITFDCVGDEAETNPGMKWFAAFGYTKDLSGTYTGSQWTLGNGLPNGFVGAPGVSEHVSAGTGAGWAPFSLDFDTSDGTTQIKLWGIAQNIDTTETDVHLCMFVDCVSVFALGPVSTATPTPPPPSTGADGWRTYR